MKVTDLPSLQLSPGRLVVFRPSALGMHDAAWTCDLRRPSYNQEAHLAYAREASRKGAPPPSWVGCAFDLPGEVDVVAFAAAVRNWIDRHENLRGHIAVLADGSLQRKALPPGAVSVECSPEQVFTDGDALARYLEALFDRQARPLHWPDYLIATVCRPGATTVLLATDHLLTDAYSTLRSAYEIHALYAAALASGGAKLVSPLAPLTTRFADFAEAERTAAEALTADHASIRQWRQFVTESGGRLPVFPLPVADMQEHPAAQPSGYAHLLDAPAAQAFDRVCRQAGGDAFSGSLACFARAGCDMAGVRVFRTMSPFNTCADPSRSIGWYVGMGPIAFPLDTHDTFDDAVRAAASSLEGVKQLAQVPMSRVAELLGQPLNDPFMVSYSDFRRTPGCRHWNTWRAVILRSRVHAPDDVYFWIFRTLDGLSVSYRHPATVRARLAVSHYLTRIKQLMACVARHACWPTTPSLATESIARDGHQAHRSSLV